MICCCLGVSDWVDWYGIKRAKVPCDSYKIFNNSCWLCPCLTLACLWTLLIFLVLHQVKLLPHLIGRPHEGDDGPLVAVLRLAVYHRQLVFVVNLLLVRACTQGTIMVTRKKFCARQLMPCFTMACPIIYCTCWEWYNESWRSDVNPMLLSN